MWTVQLNCLLYFTLVRIALVMLEREPTTLAGDREGDGYRVVLYGTIWIKLEKPGKQ